MHDGVTSAEGSASDEALEGAGTAKRSPSPDEEGLLSDARRRHIR